MKEEKFDFTPNSELQTLVEQSSQFATRSITLEEALLKVEAARTNKVLFRGERVSGISSYLAGWMAGRGIDVIVLDGANGFDPYMVSFFARKALIPPERLLKKIRIARAFTCYQMATLVERLAFLLHQEGAVQADAPFRRLPAPPSVGTGAGKESERGAVGVILLGPVTTFLDEDVPARETRPLFERTLRKLEAMAEKKVLFLLFQSCGHPRFSPFVKGMRGLQDSRRADLMKRLFEFSTLVWKVLLEEKGPKLILEKGLIEDMDVRNRRELAGGKFQRESNGISH